MYGPTTTLRVMIPPPGSEAVKNLRRGLCRPLAWKATRPRLQSAGICPFGLSVPTLPDEAAVREHADDLG